MHDFGNPRVALKQRYVAFRWASQFFDTELADGRTTSIEFTLTPHPASIVVAVVESGFSRLDADDQTKLDGLHDNTGGWEQMLALLQKQAG